jgi:hypothetical protein
MLLDLRKKIIVRRSGLCFEGLKVSRVVWVLGEIFLGLEGYLLRDEAGLQVGKFLIPQLAS